MLKLLNIYIYTYKLELFQLLSEKVMLKVDKS